MKNIPEYIFLQIDDKLDFDDFDLIPLRDISWQDERIHDTDIKYVLSARAMKAIINAFGHGYIKGYNDYRKSDNLNNYDNAVKQFKKKLEAK